MNAHKYPADPSEWHTIYFFILHKMHQILFIKLSILLINLIGISNVAGGKQHNNYEKLKEPLLEKEDDSDQFQFEVIEDGTTEEEDMEKAVALRKTAFWGLMMTTWNCDQKELKIPKDSGFESEYELIQFCGQWKRMAIAANAFVKNWQRKNEQKRGDEVGTSSSVAHKPHKMEELENSSKSHCMKPNFRVEQGELQMSSAMEVIKGVYRDLFQWGDGKWMQIEVQFANEKELKDSGCLNENFDCQNPDENIKLYKKKTEKLQQLFNLDLLGTFDILIDLAINEIKGWLNSYNKLMEMWELAEELGFDFAHMCKAGRKYKKDCIDVNRLSKEINLLKNDVGKIAKGIVNPFINDNQFCFKEKILGQFFMSCKVYYGDKTQKMDAKLKKKSEKGRKMMPNTKKSLLMCQRRMPK